METANEQIECPYKKRKLNEVDNENFCDDQADSIAENFETGSSDMVQNGNSLFIDENEENKNDKENEQSDGNGNNIQYSQFLSFMICVF